jgi:heterodisulfide reductase subunit C
MAPVQQSEEEFFVIDDELWERLVDLTGGTATLCYQCGTCTASCPWGEVRQEPLSVRRFMRRAQIGLQDGGPSLWFCTTCAQCEVYCPRGVNICDVFRSLRTIAWEQRTVPRSTKSFSTLAAPHLTINVRRRSHYRWCKYSGQPMCASGTWATRNLAAGSRF